MKLQFLSAGRLRLKKSVYIRGADRNETFEAPVISALIRHKQGNVLFDTGCHPSVVEHGEERWGSLMKVMTPVMRAEDTLLPNLACVGVNPDDIDVVVSSHFHPDHCGCNQFFRKAGASVAVNYHTSRDEAEAVVAQIQRAGGKAKPYQADIADLEAVRGMVASVESDFGGLDILVNNAGLVMRKRFNDTTPEDWHKQIDTCLYGAIHCCHAAGPLLEASGRGRIISIMGDSSRVGESGLAIASAARAGTIALMKSLAREMGRTGTTANSIALGLIESAHDRTWVDENYDKLVKAYPIRRLGQPSDVAPMVALLASDAGSWITGQVISISGGFSMV